MNEYFPLWLTADTILVGEIAPRLGAYAIAQPWDRSINVSFLPNEVIYFVPAEDRETFIRQYRLFQSWMNEVLRLQELMEPFLYEEICDVTLARIEGAVRAAMSEYTANHKIGIQAKFLEFMGISPVCEHIYFTIEYDKAAFEAAMQEGHPKE